MEILNVLVPLTGVLVLIVLLAAGTPIAFAMAIAGLLGYGMVAGFDKALSMLGLHAYSYLSHFLLSAIPLFIMMGEILSTSGITSEIFDAAHKWFGKLPGGLGVATSVACGIFGAMCGSSVAAVVAVGIVALPEMLKRGYDRRLASGLVCVGGTFAILIPPSITFVIYGSVTGESVGQLFMAGVMPGALLVFLSALYVLIVGWLHPKMAPGVTGITWKQRLSSVKPLWAIIVLIMLVLGTIYLGVCTPTEAAGLGALGAFIVAALYRRLTRSDALRAARQAAEMCGFTFILLVGAAYFAYYLTVTGMVQKLSVWLIGLQLSPWMLLVFVVVFLFSLGCFMNVIPIVVITTPVLLPILKAAGFDPIWYGVILVLCMEVAFITPPVAMNLYALHKVVPEVSIADIIRGSIPFVLIIALVIILLSIFPQIALWLPNRMIAAR